MLATACALALVSARPNAYVFWPSSPRWADGRTIAALEWFRARRVPQVVPWSAERNGPAQPLSARLGF